MAQSGGKIHAYTRGEKLEGIVVDITRKKVTLDIGGKSEGIVAEKAFEEAKEFIKTLKVGDKVMAAVIIPESPDGVTILSFRHAAQDSSWEKLEDSLTKGTPVEVRVRGVNPSGVNVEIDGLAGFIPGSQLGKSVSKNIQNMIGRSLPVKAIEVNRQQNRIVLSEKAVSEAAQMDAAKKALEVVKEGEIYEGVVTSVLDFGCFVKVKVSGKGKKKIELEGLVHVSELSWEKVESPSDIVSPGDKIKVQVIGKDKGKLSLSIKQAQKDPWEDIDKRYTKDAKVKGEVVKVSDFGVFIQIEPGVEGLVHLTKIPPGKKLQKGDMVNCYVEEIDQASRRLSLGLVLTTKPVGYK